MLTVVLPTELETVVNAAAHRTGQTLDEYMPGVCADALSLEIDRAGVDAYLDGLPGVSHDRARSGWPTWQKARKQYARFRVKLKKRYTFATSPSQPPTAGGE